MKMKKILSSLLALNILVSGAPAETHEEFLARTKELSTRELKSYQQDYISDQRDWQSKAAAANKDLLTSDLSKEQRETLERRRDIYKIQAQAAGAKAKVYQQVRLARAPAPSATSTLTPEVRLRDVDTNNTRAAAGAAQLAERGEFFRSRSGGAPANRIQVEIRR